MFIIGIIEAIGSITSIYIIRFDSDVYISIAFGSNINLDSDFNNIVVKGI